MLWRQSKRQTSCTRCASQKRSVHTPSAATKCTCRCSRHLSHPVPCLEWLHASLRHRAARRALTPVSAPPKTRRWWYLAPPRSSTLNKPWRLCRLADSCCGLRRPPRVVRTCCGRLPRVSTSLAPLEQFLPPRRHLHTVAPLRPPALTPRLALAPTALVHGPAPVPVTPMVARTPDHVRELGRVVVAVAHVLDRLATPPLVLVAALALALVLTLTLEGGTMARVATPPRLHPAGPRDCQSLCEVSPEER